MRRIFIVPMETHWDVPYLLAINPRITQTLSWVPIAAVSLLASSISQSC
jgi:hypothetical protein